MEPKAPLTCGGEAPTARSEFFTQTYFNPVRSCCGIGALAMLPKLLDGRSAVLVTFPQARALGLVARLQTLLGSHLIGVIEDTQPNPDVAQLQPMYDAFWRTPQQAQVLIALGGGSTIDTAKALMLQTENGRFDALLSALEHDARPALARTLALIAVPTTAGTGSEVTPWATLWDKAHQRKHSLHLDQTWPAAAVIDPELMLTLPAEVTLQSGLDALSHALESIWNVNANPVSDVFAVAAIHEIFETLPRLIERPNDVQLRARMALAALKAGMAFSNTKTALAHSISYAMTLRHGLPHGIACAFPLPMVLERAIGHSPQRDAVLRQALGSLESAPQRLGGFLESLGVKTRFLDYGVSDGEARAMVAHALTGARGKNFIAAQRETLP